MTRAEIEERKSAKLILGNLKEAVASCSGAIAEAQERALFSRMDLERLNVARIALAVVCQRLEKRHNYKPSTWKWLEAIRSDRSVKVPSNLLTLDNSIAERGE